MAVAPGYRDKHRFWGPAVQIEGQTRYLGARVFDCLGLANRRADGPGRLWCPDMGTDTMSDMPIRNVQRETFNSQLSTG
jgi:hypothetical protein